MDRKNLTRQDAFERVSDAKTGSLVDASAEYLEALSLEVHKWQARIDAEQRARVLRASHEQEEHDDLVVYDGDHEHLWEGPGGIQDREDFHAD